MTRVMYFESNRSSPEGMLAVGTVVMNRKSSGKYPKTVCGVVGQRNQFAAGVLSKPMGKGRDLAAKMARQVLRGAKHERVGRAMFFHTAGYSYPYSNMHYVAIAGGNAFYEKRKNATSTQESVRLRQSGALGDSETFQPRQRREAPQRQPGLFDFYTPAPVATPVSERAPRRIVRRAPEPATERFELYAPTEPTIQRRQLAPARRPEPQRLQEMSIEDLILKNG